MAYEFICEREVAFHETDMAGIVHFSNFFRWMEAVEHAFLADLGLPPVVQDGSVFWGWPRGRASCEYQSPLRYGDKVECCLFVKQIKMKSVVYFFRFHCLLPDGSKRKVAKGELTSIYAKFKVEEHSMEALALSEAILAKLEEAPASAMKPGVA